MTSTSSISVPETAAQRPSPAVVGTVLLAVVASGTALVVGPAEEYARIFPPPWVTLVAVGLLLAGSLVPRGLARKILGWAAAIFFLGGSGGIVLDVFRAFFWATGIPAGDFADVDWPGAAARSVSLLAAVVTVHHTWRLGAGMHRAASAEASTRSRRVLGGAAVVLVLPYPLLKLVWWAQDAANPAAEQEHLFPMMEILAFSAALVLVLLLLSTRTPRFLARMLVVGGWGASMALLSMGFLMVFGMLAQLTGVADDTVAFSSDGATLMVLGVYGTWLVLGVVVLAATLRLMDLQADLQADLQGTDGRGRAV